MKNYLLIAGAFIGLVALFSKTGQTADSVSVFHTDSEKVLFKSMLKSLPVGENELFMGSGACVSCHGSDPDGLTSVIDGVDVNVVDDWRATLMANSAKDPFWRAKVSHEVLVNPHLQLEIETTCTSCHAPMGHFAAFHGGATHYTIEMMLNDSVAMDGVSCLACHQLSPNGLGDTFSGQLNYDTSKVAYGPYISPLSSPMLAATNYMPVYGTHISTSELCAGCHTLITQTVDFEGEFTGDHFVEQATYHEWLNSVYNDEVSCQSCHVPRIDGPVLLSAGFPFTEERSPYGLHYFVGGNTYMTQLMKDNKAALGIDATVANFDSVLARSTRLLQQQTLDLTIELQGRDLDTAFYKLHLQNKAGHKFPSGYPARIAFIEFIVTNSNSEVLFASGVLDDEMRIVDRDVPYEPHHDIIRQQSQVQIYEMVMGDVNGNPTTVLERAKFPLKDNRLVPIGFTDFHPAYDTTLIAGLALVDPNFNKMGKQQGLGSDEVYYHVSLNDYSGDLFAVATVYYQPLPPDWMDEMFAETSPEIDYFKGLYASQSPEPLLIASQNHTDIATSINNLSNQHNILVTQRGNQFNLISTERIIESVSVFDATGRLTDRISINAVTGDFTLRKPSGVYILLIEGNGLREVKKVLLVE